MSQAQMLGPPHFSQSVSRGSEQLAGQPALAAPERTLSLLQGAEGGSLALGYLGRHRPPQRHGKVLLKLTTALSSRLCSPHFPSSAALRLPVNGTLHSGYRARRPPGLGSELCPLQAPCAWARRLQHPAPCLAHLWVCSRTGRCAGAKAQCVRGSGTLPAWLSSPRP